MHEGLCETLLAGKGSEKRHTTCRDKWLKFWVTPPPPPPSERIAKSIVDVAKNIQSDTRKVSISGILPRNDNFNNKAMEVNKELSKMCNREKLLFLEHNNIKPKTHLNKSKLHLNRNGNEKLGKNFINFINNNYAWPSQASKKVTDVSSPSLN